MCGRNALSVGRAIYREAECEIGQRDVVRHATQVDDWMNL